MWKRFWLINILLVFGSGILFAQSRLEWVKNIPLKANFVESDNMGNAYVSSQNALYKYSMDGELIMKNSALAFGEISSLDATNALKMVLYFRDLSQITYLDNLLGQRGNQIELDVVGYFQATQVCRSYNDGLWVYDQTTFELIRLNEQLELTAQSGNLGQILGYVPEPNYMREYNNSLYVNDPSNGILVFDWYGSYTKTIPVQGLSKFVVRANRLYYMQGNSLIQYDLKTNTSAKIEVKEEGITDFTIFEDKLLFLTENQLKVYRLIVE